MRRTLLRALAAGVGGALAARAGMAGSATAGEPDPGRSAPPAALRGSADDPASAREPFSFALIGDIPYNALEIRMLERVFASFGRDLRFAVHVGDIKGGWERCDDALLTARLALLEASPVPLVYVPGDNEWSDCGRLRGGGFDPNERLEFLRARHFARRSGSPAPGLDAMLESQADRTADGPPENLRWRHQGVRFVTLNLPGSNNGLKSDGLTVTDWQRRESLNDRWLRETYRMAAAAADAAVVVIAHANPRFGASARRSGTKIDGYAGFRALLLETSDAFAGPTLLLHGDTHRHRVEAITPKLLRVESYGSPFSHLWVRIEVDPGAREPFRITSRRAELPGAEP